MIDLGLVSGRAASAVRKIQQNLPLDDVDTDSLKRISDLVRASADSVQFFDSGGRVGDPPADSLVSQIETAIEVAMRQPVDHDLCQLAERLRSLADSIQGIIETRQVETASALSDYFTHLSGSVLREMSSVGETTRHL